MTLSDYSEIIAAVVGVVGLTSLLLAWLQLKSTNEWNKRNAAYTYFPSAKELDNIEAQLEELCNFWTRPKTVPLTELEAKALHGMPLSDDEYLHLKRTSGLESNTNEEVRLRFVAGGRQLKYYLSIIERYCTAINCDVVDEETARRLFKSKFQIHFGKASAYIALAQAKQPRGYQEFQTVVERWKRADTAP